MNNESTDIPRLYGSPETHENPSDKPQQPIEANEVASTNLNLFEKIKIPRISMNQSEKHDGGKDNNTGSESARDQQEEKAQKKVLIKEDEKDKSSNL